MCEASALSHPPRSPSSSPGPSLPLSPPATDTSVGQHVFVVQGWGHIVIRKAIIHETPRYPAHRKTRLAHLLPLALRAVLPDPDGAARSQNPGPKPRPGHLRLLLQCLGLDSDRSPTPALGQRRPNRPQPVSGQKVFIVTSQTKSGWKGEECSHSAIVPPPPETGSQQATGKERVTKSKSASAPESAAAPAKVISSVRRSVYKGSTRDARQEHEGLEREHPVSIPGTPLVHGILGALRKLGRLGEVRDSRGGRLMSTPSLDGPSMCRPRSLEQATLVRGPGG